MSKRLFPFIFLALSAAFAQDPVTVNPSIAKVVFENDRVRVLRIHYGPHQKLALHEHPAKVAVCLNQFHNHRLAPDGTASEGTCPAGTVSWREPEKHAVENLDDAPADTLEVELKYAHGPAIALPAASPAAPPAEPMNVELEPRHHFVFQNQYVRVLDVQIPPGDTTLYHTHSHDSVFLRLSDSQTQSQSPGGEWSETRISKFGEVRFDDNAAHLLTHRAKNVGTTLVHIIAVELLP